MMSCSSNHNRPIPAVPSSVRGQLMTPTKYHLRMITLYLLFLLVKSSISTAYDGLRSTANLLLSWLLLQLLLTVETVIVMLGSHKIDELSIEDTSIIIATRCGTL